MRLHLLLMWLSGIVPITLSIVAHKYHLILTPMTWPAAQNYCREMNGELAEIQSFGDWLRIAGEALKYFMIFPAWIGLYNNVDSWRWSLDNLPLKNMTLSNWKSDEPTNGMEACGAIDFTGYWFDFHCTDLKFFICYDSGLSGSARFIHYNLPLLDWFGAQAYCRQHHTDLATATNSNENNELKNLVPFLSSSWFGLFRDTWTWLDGTIASNIPWGLLQPDNFLGADNCATFAIGLIGDETCSSTFPFYCHTTPPVRQQQIMKLQVEFNGNVLDPAVQASILEKIKRKLEEKGVVNVTLSWRVQPDGNIFQKKKKDEL